MSSSAPLKGRRKFNADLLAAIGHFQGGQDVDGAKIKQLTNGEDEGSIICKIADATGKVIATLSLIISDTSEYPNHHTFFCFAQDSDPPAYVSQVVESVVDQGSATIEQVVTKILQSIGKKLGKSAANGHAHHHSDDEGEEDEEMDYDAYDDDMMELSADPKTNEYAHHLQRDFNEIVAADFRPGLIRLSADELVLSVSVPVVYLARIIPPRALMAWDSRLLSKKQHLTLIISGMRNVYPVLQSDGTLNPRLISSGVSKLQFRVGLSPEYKPPKEAIPALIRLFGLKDIPVEPEPVAPQPMYSNIWDGDEEDDYYSPPVPTTTEVEQEDENVTNFHFSLSASMETLLQDWFLGVVQLRLKYRLRWAAAERLFSESQRTQISPDDLMLSAAFTVALDNEDAEEQQLAHTYNLPVDPLIDLPAHADHMNIGLVAFSYLLRRLTLCTRYCLICYNKLETDVEALKPYVCDSKLCTYQYYSLNRGPSLEYEICTRPEIVDLHVSLTYIASREGALQEPLPTGMGLSVTNSTSGCTGPLYDFDTLSHQDMCRAVANLLDTLPTISDMKKFLEKRTRAGAAKPKLSQMDSKILPAAWLLLRWCVASCRAHLEELTEPEERVRNFDKNWRQFRFSVGAPDAEAKHRAAQAQAMRQDANAKRYPILYAFHGSPAKNWHSIIRHGLWYKSIAHGRAYGDGVYFAKDGGVSIGSYARGTSSRWCNTELNITSCVVLAEIINLPDQFTSQNPYFVVKQTDWILCRYLLVNAAQVDNYNFGYPYGPNARAAAPESSTAPEINVPSVPMDPKHPLTIGGKPIIIPQPSWKLEKLLADRQSDYFEEDNDDEDRKVFEGVSTSVPFVADPTPASSSPPVSDNWRHDAQWVESCIQHMLPAPRDAMPSATMAVQRELKAILKEQEKARSLEELGWYMPPEFISDNLFQWIVELHSFDKKLPIAQDLEKAGINSLVFEVRFPPNFPEAPPFFRILKPRFLPFSQGGGGHVTAGGSMCMDLLTSSGWSPAYAIPAILLQIKLAISNLDPRPARLAHQWSSPYSMHEAIDGYKRAAAVHGWQIPATLQRMTY